MDVKRLGFIAAIFQIVACTQTKDFVKKEQTYFENYALAICLGSAFEDDRVKADFNKSASGYMERGHMSIEAYEELRSAVPGWLKKDYPSKHGDQVNSAKCFDFYRSSELAEMFNKYDPCRSKAGWLDTDEYAENCSDK